MNQINVKEKCWEENTSNKRKTRKNIKEEMNKYERKITDDIRKRRSMTPQRKKYMISMKLNYQQKNGLSILQLFGEKSTRSIQIHSLNNGIH